jgi:glutathione S-transferase
MSEDSQVIAKYLDQIFRLDLFPAELEGVQSILWCHIESQIEDVAFRLTDIHWRELVPPEDHLRFIRHKERKFGRDCLEQWRRLEPELLQQLEDRLLPYEEMLSYHSFLLDTRPRFVDFDLFGMLGDFLYTGHYKLPRSRPNIQKWYRRMASAKLPEFST